MKENEKFIQVKDAKELSVRESHLEVINNLPSDFERVNFDDPRSIIQYGHDDKQAISDILINTAGLSVKQGRNLLTDDMIQRLYSFDDELEASDKFNNRKELAIVTKAKKKLTELGVKRFQEQEEQNSYGAKYQKYCDNIVKVCKYVEESKQESLADIDLRTQIAWDMKPHLEHMQMTIKAGEADYFLFLEEIENLKKQLENTEDIIEKETLKNEIVKKEQMAFVFNDKLDKLRKVFTSYVQQLLVYAEQQKNEMILVNQQESFIEDQQPILRAQGSSMIFNREQQSRADDMEKLGDATNKAYQANSKAIMQNTEKIADLAINGGLKIESIQEMHEAIGYSIKVMKDMQGKLKDRIAVDEGVIRNVLAASEEYEQELQGVNEMLEGLTEKPRQKTLGTRYANKF